MHKLRRSLIVGSLFTAGCSSSTPAPSGTHPSSGMMPAPMTAAHAVATAAPIKVPTTRLAPFAHVSPLRGWSTTIAEIASQMPCVSCNPCHSAVAMPAADAARMV